MSTDQITTKPSARATAIGGHETDDADNTTTDTTGEPEISDEELLTELQRLTVEKEKVVTAPEIDADSKFSAGTYFRRFDSLADARAQAGVDALGVAIMLDEICPHRAERRINGPDVELDLEWNEPGIGPDTGGI